MDAEPFCRTDRGGFRQPPEPGTLRLLTPECRSTYEVIDPSGRISVVTRPDGSQFTVFAVGEDVWMTEGVVGYVPTRDPLLESILAASW